jgi:uncharacterized membrane protein
MKEATILFLPVCTLIIAILNLFIPCNNIILIFLSIHIIFVSYVAVNDNMKQREENGIEDITFY